MSSTVLVVESDPTAQRLLREILEQAGYRVTLLEARDRIAGRSWTMRGQERIVMDGRADQRASFSPGLYFNAGPARLPSHHHVILEIGRAHV